MNKRSDFIDPVKAAQAVQAIRSSLAALGEEGDDQLLLDSIEGETDFFEVLDKLLERRAESLAHAEGLGLVIDRLKARQERFEKAADVDRTLIEQALLTAELEVKITRPIGTLFLSRRAPKAEILEEADIPAEFWKPAEPKLDKKAVLDALKAGQTVPGAALSNSAPTLTIRTQ